MAIKGNNSSSSNNSNGGSSRGKPYGVMLLIAFGAALLGVLVVHKLRERRIFNILVTEKEQQLISLHLLLQKEREESNSMKKKVAGMKKKVETLRTEKMELDRRVLEMQSTIDSLKDEGKALETALEEKQNEIKSMREAATTANSDSEKESSRVAALTESLKLKEAEIQELKRRSEGGQVKVWSVGSDDPSKNSLSSNGTKADVQGEKNKGTEGGQSDESSKQNEILNSTRSHGDDDDDAGGGSGKIPDRRKLPATGNGTANSDAAKVNSRANVKKDIINTAREEPVKVLPAADGNMTSQDLVRTTNSDAADGNGKDVTNMARKEAAKVESGIRGGMRMEMNDEVDSGNRNRKPVHSRKARGKKWRMPARKRWLGNNMSHGNDESLDSSGAGSANNRKVNKGEEEPQSKEPKVSHNDEAAMDGRSNGEVHNVDFVLQVEDEEGGSIKAGQAMDNAKGDNDEGLVEIADTHEQETEIEPEKDVEDADLMHKGTEPDPDSSEQVTEEGQEKADPSEF